MRATSGPVAERYCGAIDNDIPTHIPSICQTKLAFVPSHSQTQGGPHRYVQCSNHIGVVVVIVFSFLGGEHHAGDTESKWESVEQQRQDERVTNTHRREPSNARQVRR